MSIPQTLIELIEGNRKVARNITYLNGENDERSVSFAELYQRALGILHHLQQLGAKRGDHLILFLGENEPFIDAFWGAVLGGIVPVPVALGISDEHRHKLLRIARKLGNPFLYTDRRSLERIRGFADKLGQEGGTDRGESAAEAAAFARLSQRTFLIDQLEDISKPGKVEQVQPDDVAFIQFSSGSTSEPKGVVLTHRNILANAEGVRQKARFTDNDVSVSWMPLTHDMGLIGFHIFMFYFRVHQHLMPTDLFVRRPLLWLTFASRKRATILCSPNFGYRHYLKVLGERPIEGLDLSSVRLIFNGAEPISVDLCNEFLDRLAPAKLPRNAMYPVYGLAEASLAATFPEPGAALQTIALDRHQLTVGQPAQQVLPGTRDAVELVSVGAAIPFCQVRVAGDDDRELPAGTVGHILMTGDNVTRRYFEGTGEQAAADRAVNAAAFTPEGWLRTGDLGVVVAGNLYITGRHKEILFVNGQNYYPHDLEGIAQQAPGLDLGKVVVAGVRPKDAQTDQVIVFVLHRGDVKDFMPTAAEVSKLINEHTGLEVADVVPVKRIPKTTSGKIQRHLLEQEYLEGAFGTELAELGQLRDTLRGPAAANRTQLEARLADICEAALGKRLGPGDNLFEIGASSLKLIEIHEQIDKDFPGLVDLTELFDYPTIGELASHIEDKLKAAT